jgi:hypothetical protein
MKTTHVHRAQELGWHAAETALRVDICFPGQYRPLTRRQTLAARVVIVPVRALLALRRTDLADSLPELLLDRRSGRLHVALVPHLVEET